MGVSFFILASVPVVEPPHYLGADSRYPLFSSSRIFRSCLPSATGKDDYFRSLVGICSTETKCCVISFSTCSFDKLIILVWLLVNPELSQFTYSLCTCSTLIPIFSTFYRVTVYTHCSNRYFESLSVHHGRSPTFTMQPLTLTLYFLLALFCIFIRYKHSIACILLVVNTFLKLF